MKKHIKNLLPKKIFDRVAQNLKFSKLKLGFPKKVVWLTISIFLFLTLSGYYPSLTIPPIKHSAVSAKELEQKAEIIADSFSKPPTLPHPGYLSTRFSYYHPGIDIAAGLGMSIHPIIDGIVEEAGRDFFGLGNYVVIRHEKEFKSKYAHMGKIYTKMGAEVTTESIIGEVGLTGRTSGPHTHLEVTLHGKFIDPQKILPDLPNMPVRQVRQ